MSKKKKKVIENNFVSTMSKISVIFLMVTLLVFAGYKAYDMGIKDKTAPVITVPDSVLSVSVRATESDLLRDVKASDDKSGDVTDNVLIEKLSSIDSDNNRTIHYVALDDSNNVGRAERTLHYTDYKLPEFSMTKGSLIVKIDGTINIMDYIKASSILDGNVTGFVKYSFDDKLDTSTLGEYPVQFYVTDSAGGVSKLDTTLLVVSDSEVQEPFLLRQYLAYVNMGDDFVPNDYISEEMVYDQLDIETNVNVDQRGIYTVDYYATRITPRNAYNSRARLIVIVR